MQRLYGRNQDGDNGLQENFIFALFFPFQCRVWILYILMEPPSSFLNQEVVWIWFQWELEQATHA